MAMTPEIRRTDSMAISLLDRVGIWTGQTYGPIVVSRKKS